MSNILTAICLLVLIPFSVGACASIGWHLGKILFPKCPQVNVFLDSSWKIREDAK